jgi:hypothetical protein
VGLQDICAIELWFNLWRIREGIQTKVIPSIRFP